MRLPSGIGLVFLAASLESQDQTIGRAGILYRPGRVHERRRMNEYS